MPDKPRDYDISTIRKLLLAAFSAETLERFCQDRPLFRPLLHEFGPAHGLADMVDEMVVFCEKQRLWDELLPEVERENPRQYYAFKDRLYRQQPTAAPPPAGMKVKWPWEPPRPNWFLPAVGAAAVLLALILALALWPRPPDPPVATSTPTNTRPPETQPPETQPPTEPPATEEVAVVPNVQGTDCDRAQDELADLGLRLDEEVWEVSDTVEYPGVIQTDPPPGTEVEPGSSVMLVCSLGPMRSVPGVTGQSPEDAQAWLEGDCCPPPPFQTVLEYETAGDPAEIGTVIRTEPSSGKLVEPGSVVTLTVAVEPTEVTVPQVADLTVEVASARLAASYLDVGTVDGETSATVREGRVIRCDPPSGETVVAGSQVDLWVSEGPELVIVPDLIDWSWDAAEAELERLGLGATNTGVEYHDDIAPGRVTETNPRATERVVLGHEIEIMLSLGLDPAGDRDGDGMPNGWEEDHKLDPRVNDASSDPDRDGMSNLDEYRNRTDPRSADLASIRAVLMYRGERLASFTSAIPEFDLSGTKADLGTAYDARLSEFTVYNAPAGKYYIHAGVDVDGDGYPHAGDLRSGYVTFEISSDRDTVSDYISLYEVIHLTEPVNNAFTIKRHDSKTFDIYDQDELFFRWDSVSGATSYQVIIWEWEYEPNEKQLDTVLWTNVEGTSYRPDLPPSPAGRYYKLILNANRPLNLGGGGLWVEYSCWPGSEQMGYVFRVR